MSNGFSNNSNYNPPGNVYLNSPANGVMSATTFEAGREADELCLKDTPGYFQQFITAQMSELRTTLARNLSVNKSDLAFVSSFSVGHNFLLSCLNPAWKVWTLDGDYPSLTLPFELYGFKQEKCVIPNASLSTERILESIDKTRPDLVVLSHVQWLSGFKVNLKSLGEFCRSLGILTLIDGTQYFGTGPLDLSDIPIDAYGSSGYKWLLAGFGNGFLYTHPSFFEKLNIRVGGFGSFLNFDNEWNYAESMKNFEPGHHDPISFIRMKNALLEMEANDPKKISEHIHTLDSSFLIQADEHQLDVLNYSANGEDSAILSIGLSDEHVKRLEKNDVRFSERGGRTRIGFHLYNTAAEIDRTIEILTS